MPPLKMPTRIIATSSVVAAAVASTLCLTTAAASADVPEPPRPAFYEAPATLPAENGAVIRSESLDYLLDPFDFADLVRNSQRILYKSTDREGEAIATSGSVLVPKTSWIGSGSRPLIVLTPGTQGMADQCAPSRLFSEGFEYEAASIEPLLARGYAVVIPDYEGLGTEGVHTYMDRVSQGQVALDSARAALALDGTGLSPSTRVGLMGYSQGGGAAGSAAELAESYAPDLDIRGAAVGAAPADLEAVANNLDGTLYSAFAFFALRGLAASYDLDLDPYLNAEGQSAMDGVEQDCVFNLFDSAFTSSEELTIDGKPMSDLMTRAPFNTIIADQRIGTIAPSMPVLVTHSRLDDVIPFTAGRQMARGWCDADANVRFVSNVVPTHVGGMVPHVNRSLAFFEARFAGIGQASNCWTL